ncbi:MAG: LPS assembly lipoprotein LptE [Emcibacteraceae bacterium]|nr:LPS assembly lipoprotein LptE [Emcibacteraceae bacterium]MDG1997229.1 LPS assembly lipoprotein LptE [Emcibacteraceae bacterium]
MILQVKFLRQVGGIVMLMLLTSCGFKPMYGTNAAGGAELAQILANIKIDPVRSMSGRQERLSQLIENNLQDRISPIGANGQINYVLKASYEVQEQGYGIREDESVTLQNLRLSVAFQLVDIESDQPIMDGTARAIVTYDLVQSDFSNMTARQSSLERLAEEAANQVVTRVGTYLNNNGSKE